MVIWNLGDILDKLREIGIDRDPFFIRRRYCPPIDVLCGEIKFTTTEHPECSFSH